MFTPPFMVWHMGVTSLFRTKTSGEIFMPESDQTQAASISRYKLGVHDVRDAKIMLSHEWICTMSSVR
jgi:hypothetical protein